MNQYQIIENLLEEPNKKQMVFCAIYTVGKPYSEYDYLEKSKRGIDIPLVLMQVRWDGFIGFPGGKVDDGESLVDAVIREMYEEISFVGDASNLVPLCSFSTDIYNIHCFSYEVEFSLLKEIIQKSTTGEHFLSENQGCFALQLAEFEKGGYREFQKHNFKATAGLELEILSKKLGIVHAGIV